MKVISITKQKREKCWTYQRSAPGLGGGAIAGEFDVSKEARVKFPAPGQLMNVNFQPLG